MGCFYTTCQVKKSSYTSLTTNSPSFSFSFPNEEFFLVPKNFNFEVGQLKDIIMADQALWKNYRNVLLQMTRSFHEKVLSIHWFLNSQKSEESSKVNSLSSIYLMNSTNLFTQSSTGNSVCLQKNFAEHFPFMKKVNNEGFKSKIIFEINSVICTKNFLLRNPNYDFPSVEIEILSYEDSKKEDEGRANFPEIYKVHTHTKPFSQGRSFEWKEVIECEILNNSEFDQGFFKISLHFYNKHTKKKELVGDNYIFAFSELGNQMIFEKILNIKDFEGTEISCFLLFKCQLIFDVEGLLCFWKNDIEVKREVVRRMLMRIDKKDQGRLKTPEMKKSKSLIFQDKKIKEDLKLMMESFHTAFNRTLNMSLRNERVSFREAYKKTFAQKLVDSLISQESGLSQSGYYDNKYYLA